MLKNEEGVRHTPYKDHLGYDTVGVGHLIDPRKGGSLPPWAQEELDAAGHLSDRTIDKLLEDDIIKAMELLNKHIPWAVNLDPVRYGVLLDMTFQMGIGTPGRGDGLLGFKNTLSMVERGDYSKAAEGMKHSLWYKQTPNRADRRRAEMLTGKFHEYH